MNAIHAFGVLVCTATVAFAAGVMVREIIEWIEAHDGAQRAQIAARFDALERAKPWEFHSFDLYNVPPGNITELRHSHDDAR